MKYTYTKDGLVVSIIYLMDLSGNASCSGPAGSEEHILPLDSPVQMGWRYVFDEGTETYIFLPPF